jgi:hypothetical protein
MAKSFKLSSVGGLAVAGAALGLYLGSSAISEINPAYYSTPSSASSFHADLVPNQGDRDTARPLPEMAETVSDVGPTCISCGLDAAEYAAINHLPADRYGSYGPAPAEVVVAEADEHVSQGLSPREASDIERYAHFRVSQEEERPALAALSRTEGDDASGAAAGAEKQEAAPGI